MRAYRSEAATQTPELVGSGVGLGDLVVAATIAAGALVIVGGGVSLLVWRSVWVELCIGLALVPYVILAAAMLLWLRRGVLQALEGMTGLDLDGNGSIGDEQIRLVPVNRRVMVNGVDSEDLALFARAAIGSGDWTQAAWRGRHMPSGRRCTNDYHAALMGVLVKAGIVQDYGPRSKGYLAVSDTEAALQRLGV